VVANEAVMTAWLPTVVECKPVHEQGLLGLCAGCTGCGGDGPGCARGCV
jgi:hypothetical protein